LQNKFLFEKFFYVCASDHGSVLAPLTALRDDMYFWFCGWRRHIFIHGANGPKASSTIVQLGDDIGIVQVGICL